jgi:hypothetical protein
VDNTDKRQLYSVQIVFSDNTIAVITGVVDVFQHDCIAPGYIVVQTVDDDIHKGVIKGIPSHVFNQNSIRSITTYKEQVH